jgi:hypothetical protein
MESPTGLIPEELMFPAKWVEVVRFLQAQPWPSDLKREVLTGYAVTVGVKIPDRYKRAVGNSGVDAVYDGEGTYVRPA